MKIPRKVNEHKGAHGLHAGCSMDFSEALSLTFICNSHTNKPLLMPAPVACNCFVDLNPLNKQAVIETTW